MVTLRRTGRDGGPFRIVFGFDSISAFVWPSFPNGQPNPAPSVTGDTGSLAALISAGALASGSKPPVRTGPTSGVIANPSANTSTFLWYNSGVAGDDCTNVVGNVATRVNQYAPDLVIIFLGVNCIQHSVPDATCLTNHASIIAQIKSANPGVQILVLDIMCIQEDWPVGANPFDTQIDTKIATAIAPTAAGSNVTYAPLRSAFFSFQAANNPGHLKVLGPLTNSDASALHPNWRGCQWLASTIIQYFRYA